MVLTEEDPEPKVLVVEPVAMVEAPLEVRVVKAPVEAVPEPIGPGAANVAPERDEAFKLATLVVEVMMSGAVPVAIVEVSWVPEIVEATVSAPAEVTVKFVPEI